MKGVYIFEVGKTSKGRWKRYWFSAESQGRSLIPAPECNGYLNRPSNYLITLCPCSCIPTDFQSLLIKW